MGAYWHLRHWRRRQGNLLSSLSSSKFNQINVTDSLPSLSLVCHCVGRIFNCFIHASFNILAPLFTVLFPFLSCYTIIKDGETFRDSPAVYLHQSLVAEDICTQRLENYRNESRWRWPRICKQENWRNIHPRVWVLKRLLPSLLPRGAGRKNHTEREIYGEEGLVSSRKIWSGKGSLSEGVKVLYYYYIITFYV
jgi:hypothetical protein